MTNQVQIPVSSWSGCYDLSWRHLITPQSFSHPAKFARGLVQRIYSNCLDRGYLKRGDRVIDCFAGIGTGGIIAASLGLQWIGCELEPKFVDLAEQNFALHRHTWETFGDPLPVIVQGDSRRLRAVLGPVLAECVVSSPPYATGDTASAESIFRRDDKSAAWVKANCGSAATEGYGQSPGQLAALPAGDVDAVVSSPPYEGSMDSIEDAEGRNARTAGFACGQKNLRYGQNPNTFLSRDPSGLNNDQRHEIAAKNPQVGALKDDTFWQAAAEIVRECHAILKPGGLAVWVTKAFVRDRCIVDFPGDWRRLCEHAGFETLEEVHASLVKEERNPGLFGEHVSRKERKSFFRRLAEKKGSPAIDYEVVWFMRKPGAAKAQHCCAGADCVLSSPPFQESMSDNPSLQILAGSGGRMGQSCKGDNYGTSSGQLGAMPSGDVDAVLSSPPYPECLHNENGIDYSKSVTIHGTKSSAGRNALGGAYGQSAGQMGAMVEGKRP